VHEIHLKQNLTQPQKDQPSCCPTLFSSENPGSSEFFPRGSGLYLDSLLSLPDRRSYGKFSGGFGISNLSVADLDLRVFSLLFAPTTFLPSLEFRHPLEIFSHLSINSHLLESKIQPCIQDL
jgi:hypothetical protein